GRDHIETASRKGTELVLLEALTHSGPISSAQHRDRTLVGMGMRRQHMAGFRTNPIGVGAALRRIAVDRRVENVGGAAPLRPANIVRLERLEAYSIVGRKTGRAAQSSQQREREHTYRTAHCARPATSTPLTPCALNHSSIRRQPSSAASLR